MAAIDVSHCGHRLRALSAWNTMLARRLGGGQRGARRTCKLPPRAELRPPRDYSPLAKAPRPTAAKECQSAKFEGELRRGWNKPGSGSIESARLRPFAGGHTVTAAGRPAEIEIANIGNEESFNITSLYAPALQHGKRTVSCVKHRLEAGQHEHIALRPGQNNPRPRLDR